MTGRCACEGVEVDIGKLVSLSNSRGVEPRVLLSIVCLTRDLVSPILPVIDWLWRLQINGSQKSGVSLSFKLASRYLTKESLLVFIFQADNLGHGVLTSRLLGNPFA